MSYEVALPSAMSKFVHMGSEININKWTWYWESKVHHAIGTRPLITANNLIHILIISVRDIKRAAAIELHTG